MPAFGMEGKAGRRAWRGPLAGLAVWALASPGMAVPARSAAFDIVPLGVEGGLVEGATTAWYLAAHAAKTGLACDAGTLVPGIRAGREHGAFPKGEDDGTILHERIRAYAITHAHLDHVAGMVMASPDDSAKPIFALGPVNDALAQDYFNWSAWPNMGDRGAAPQLGRYTYRDLSPGSRAQEVEGTDLALRAFPLAHGGVLSTAFLVQSGPDAILCMGDTGPDAVEGSDRLDQLWQAVAPLVRAGHLRAILVETSYTNARRDEELFGHLTPRWLNRELERLAGHVGDTDALRGLNVVIGHIKPSLALAREPAVQTIARELEESRTLPVRFWIARQGERLTF
ncbi:3',5'-cyclic-nucleotide phosphodiesterase [Novosphingobium profundi]|uniref:3',5'-cyclic-nucleotide phosphodiesterase n=1 Tax=Novosphingobium profundi TaxID=1774954 RepID=UPI001CFDC60A|nr:3',5'-cyclic-nucleotide phosphodiesterase [Novosphingobium profundi]